MQVTLITLVGIFTILTLISITAISITKSILLSKTVKTIIETKAESDKYIQKLNYSVQDSRNLLEYLVDQKLTEWQIYNIDPDTDNYITEVQMQDAIEYIIKKIIVEMTPVTKDKLSIGFPMESQEDMIESIKNRAKLAVLNYSIKQNAPQEHDEVIKNINTF